MKLSIIVATYNIEDYIEDCIRSLVKQDLSNCEVLLIDDGSTDNSGEICKNYSSGNSAVKYFYKENGGVGSARNYGITKAKGEFIWFIDGDDEIIDNSIELLLNTLTVFDSQLIMFYMLHKRLYEKNLRLESDMIYLKDSITLKFINTVKMFPTSVCCFLFEKKFLDENKLLFDDNMNYEDDHFMFRVYNNNCKISVLNKALYIYKAREGSTMKSVVSEKKIRSKFKIIKLLHEMSPKGLSEILIKNKLFFYIKDYILLNANYELKFLDILFETVPKQKIFFQDPKGVIFEKLLYNYFKKGYCKKVIKNII